MSLIVSCEQWHKIQCTALCLEGGKVYVLDEEAIEN